MKSDYKFKVAQFYSSYACLAARNAVFTPVLGSDDWISGDRLSFVGVLRRWRQRTIELSDAGCLFLQKPSDLACIRNCRPLGVSVVKFSRTCGRPHVCPFCYGRAYPLRAFDWLKKFLFKGKVCRRDYKIVDFCTTMEVKIPSDKWDTPGYQEQAWYNLLKGIRANRQKESKAVEARCGVLFHRMFVREHTCIVQRSGILFTKRHNSASKLTKGATVAMDHGPMTLKELAVLVGHVFRYPQELMTEEPASIIKMLYATKKTRVYSTFGGR